MSRDDNTRFRIRVWPQVPLPLPATPGGFPFRYDRDADALVPDWNAPRRDRPEIADSELYLKFAELDPGDVDSLVDFVSAHGEIDVRGRYDHRGTPQWGTFPLSEDEMPELQEALLRATSVCGVEFADTLTEIRWAILYMRDLIAARRVLEGEIDGADHVWESPFWDRVPDSDSPPWRPEGPAVLLTRAFDAGLSPYTPHIEPFREDREPVPLWAGEVRAWNVCCLELFNHIVEAARYKNCANETCGRLFVRQEGRALHGQHRTRGVKYCSSSCARAQAQREYRRRKGEEG